MKEALVLGCGYVGSFYLDKYPENVWTKRSIKTTTPNKNQVLFNLHDKLTWNHIPNLKNILWTFNSASNEIESQNAIKFFQSHLKNKNVIILSTTSAYKTIEENEFVNENTPIEFQLPRFKTEEFLRNEGALILHLSGIIGPNRMPRKWYESERVQYAENILNYVHVKDIIYFIEALFQNFISGERFNLTSADYKTHMQIYEWLVEHQRLPQTKEPPFVFPKGTLNSKKVENSKILLHTNNQGYAFLKYPEQIEI